MKSKRLVLTCLRIVLTILGACAFLVQAGPAVTDPMVAGKLNISVQQLHSLRAAFDLSNSELLAVPPYQLQLMLFDLSHPGFEKHAEEQKFRALQMMDEQGRIAPDGLLRAMEHRRHMQEEEEDMNPVQPDPGTNAPDFGLVGARNAGLQNGAWTWVGPGNIGGRVRSIVVHPALTNIMWCGSVGGGIWKTTNSGAAWFALDDFMANLAVSCMIIDPVNPNTLYAGTGEPMYNSDSVRGAGIFKTIDGGSSWFRLSSTATSSFYYVSRLAIDPNNNSILLASTRSGIYRSTNGGTNWTQTLATETMDLQFHPTDSSQAVASGRSGQAWYSADGGQSWTQATGISGSRVEITYSPANPSIVFASVDSSSGQIYVSSDGGHTYVLRNTGNSYLGSQGWYDNVIWADPTTTNNLIVGGIDLWRSTDGGATLTRISQWQNAPSSAHADQHVITSIPGFDGSSRTTVLFGNDGGVYRAANVYTVSGTTGWQSLNNNLGITQFYGGAGNTGTGVVTGGTQDNGTLRYLPASGPQAWTTTFGGDGGFSAADPTDGNYLYGEYVYLEIHRSSNGGASASYIYTGISDAGSSANFIAPFILDPNNANTMLAGGYSLWRSTNVKASPPTWTSIKSSITNSISAIAVARGNSDVIWVGHNNGDVYYTANGTSSSPTWTRVDTMTPSLPNRYCGRIAIDPYDANRVYVVFGGFNSDNVWRTVNSGTNWVNITGNLPAAPMTSILISTIDTNTLYVSSEVGVYGTTNGGVNWSVGNDGPANVAVDELFWQSNKLFAVTHGRGMFYTTPLIGPANLTTAGAIVSGGNANGIIDPSECNDLTLNLQNIGAATASNITATLTTTTPGVVIVQGTSAYSTLPGGVIGTNTTPFRIASTDSLACAAAISLTLTVKHANGTTVLTYNLTAGGDAGLALTQGTGGFVPGTTDVGNHGDDVVTTISLPFSYQFYDRSFNSASVSANGNLQFLSSSTAYNNQCLPYTTFNYAIIPCWDDLRTDLSGGGIFTSTSGVAPNRIFNIEWRANYFGTSSPLNFEIRLYEAEPRFDIAYATLNGNGSDATVGVQKDTGSMFYTFECSAGGLSDGLLLTFRPSCTPGSGPCAELSGPPLITSQPFDTSVSQGNTAALSATVIGGTPLNYQWYYGSTPLSDGGRISGAQSNQLQIASSQLADSGSYQLIITNSQGGATSSVALLSVGAAPAIVNPPTNQTVNPGGTATFTVGATGSPPLNYDWFFNNGRLGVTISNLVLNNVQLANAGSYRVVVSNSYGVATSAVATLIVPVAPAVVSGPSNVVAFTSSALSLSSSFTGASPLAYQWSLNGVDLNGATNTSLSITNLQSNHGGLFQIRATNLYGTATATSSVTVVTQPQNVTVAQGTNATFSAAATGPTALSYQWLFTGTNLSGATTATLTITNAQIAKCGAYLTRVSSAINTITSAPAFLSINIPATNYPSSALAPASMVNWWPGDGNAVDIFGGNNGFPQFGISYVPGKVGSAFYFDGITNQVNLSVTNPVAAPWTFCCWVNRQNALGASATILANTTAALKIEQYNLTRQVGVTLYGVGDYTFGYSAPAGTWVHLAFVGTSTNITLYTNAVRQSALAISTSLPRSFLGVGYASSSSKFIDRMLGSLDEILIFNRALDATEIATIFGAGSSGLVQAPEFAGGGSASGGNFILNLRGKTGKNISVYSSSDLLNWFSLGTWSNASGAFQLTNSMAPDQRFFKATQP